MGAWRIVVYFLLPYAIGHLIWRGLRYRKYWRRWPERFGFVLVAGAAAFAVVTYFLGTRAANAPS